MFSFAYSGFCHNLVYVSSFIKKIWCIVAAPVIPVED